MAKRMQKPDFEPAENEEVVRQFRHKTWGSLPVVRRKTVERTKVPVLDENGEQVVRRSGPFMNPVLTPMWKYEDKEVEKEFLWLPINSVHASYVEEFEPSPETIMAEKRRARKEQLLDEWLEAKLDEEFAEKSAPTPEREVDDGFPRHVGGPYFELSDGTKVKGREEAFVKEQELGSG